MPNVKKDRKTGAWIVSPSGWENFAALLSSFTQEMQRQQMMKRQDKKEAANIELTQAQFRTQLGQLAQSDPETYNQLIEDPSVKKLLDPMRVTEAGRASEGMFEKFVRERRERKADPFPTPSQVQLAPVSPERIAAIRKEREAKNVASDLSIKQAGFEGMRTDFLNGLITSDNAYDRLAAAFGRPLSQQDKVGLATTAEQAAVQAEGATPGSLVQLNQRLIELLPQYETKYNITSATDRAQVRKLAQWHLGLSTEMPEGIPKQFAQIEVELANEGNRLRRSQLGLDQQRMMMERNARIVDVATALQQRGVDPNLVFPAAQQLLNTGELPKEVVIGPDQKLELEKQLMDVRLQEVQAQLLNARADDPEIDALARLLSSTSETGRPAEWNQLYKKMVTKLGQKHGWKVTENDNSGFWNRVRTLLGGAPKPSATVEDAPSAAAPTAPTAPAATTSVKPEQLESELMSTIQQATAKMAQGSDPLLKLYLQQLYSARQSRDLEQQRVALQTLRMHLTGMGGRAQ